MQTPEVVIGILSKRSLNNLPIKDIYRCLFNPLWYYDAFNSLAPTRDLKPNETKRIDSIIDNLKLERYTWTKDTSGQYKDRIVQSLRHLSKDHWSDRILQEVLYKLLNHIYEPRFKDTSHWDRPNKGVHTALTQIRQKSRGCELFIEFHTHQSFKDMDPKIMIKILSKVIHDGRFLELIRKMLLSYKFSNNFINNRTYSGVSIGTIPLFNLLGNIYYHELDVYIESNLYDKFTHGKMRPRDINYQRLSGKIQRLWKVYHENDKPAEMLTYIRKLQKLRCKRQTGMKIELCNFRRFSYTRYGDSWLISLIGTKEDATYIRDSISKFLKENLAITLDSTSTKILKSTKECASFLNYLILKQYNRANRSVNAEIGFLAPEKVINQILRKYAKNGKPYHLSYRIHETIFDMINLYQIELREIAQYYKFCRNQQILRKVKWYMESSLLRTMAAKLKRHMTTVKKMYQGTKTYDGFTYKVIKTSIKSNDEDDTQYVTAYFGAIPFKRKIALDCNVIRDLIFNPVTLHNRSSRSERLTHKQCIICGSNEKVELHHLNKISNVDKTKGDWFLRQCSINRRTIPLCDKCHYLMHNGIYNDRKLS
jgi:hypothetical protein|nr:MAG TPA: hypothetical protein [Caudoviricetes sp.]